MVSTNGTTWDGIGPMNYRNQQRTEILFFPLSSILSKQVDTCTKSLGFCSSLEHTVQASGQGEQVLIFRQEVLLSPQVGGLGFDTSQSHVLKMHSDWRAWTSKYYPPSLSTSHLDSSYVVSKLLQYMSFFSLRKSLAQIVPVCIVHLISMI